MYKVRENRKPLPGGTLNNAIRDGIFGLACSVFTLLMALIINEASDTARSAHYVAIVFAVLAAVVFIASAIALFRGIKHAYRARRK
jgi:hypothetical protein